jgi:hypothetical protein
MAIPCYHGATRRTRNRPEPAGPSRAEQEDESGSTERKNGRNAEAMRGGAVAARVAHNPEVESSGPSLLGN